MEKAEAIATPDPCEDCGGHVVADLEPVVSFDHLEFSEWCTNLDCRSNHALPGLWRLGVNDYQCRACGQMLKTPIAAVLAHVRSH